MDTFLTPPQRIEEQAVYDDRSARALFGLSAPTLARARASGELTFARAGTRTIYLGEWLLAWLRSSSGSFPLSVPQEAGDDDSTGGEVGE